LEWSDVVAHLYRISTARNLRDIKRLIPLYLPEDYQHKYRMKISPSYERGNLVVPATKVMKTR
jgi:hypothetical protein